MFTVPSYRNAWVHLKTELRTYQAVLLGFFFSKIVERLLILLEFFQIFQTWIFFFFNKPWENWACQPGTLYTKSACPMAKLRAIGTRARSKKRHGHRDARTHLKIAIIDQIGLDTRHSVAWCRVAAAMLKNHEKRYLSYCVMDRQGIEWVDNNFTPSKIPALLANTAVFLRFLAVFRRRFFL